MLHSPASSTASLARWSCLLLILLLALVLSACTGAVPGNSAAQTAPTIALPDIAIVTNDANASPRTVSAEAGAVTVAVTAPDLQDETTTTFDFDVAMNTHSVELGVDLAQMAVLKVADQEVPAVGWQTSANGGHHVSGVLSFRAADVRGLLDGAAEISLLIRQLAEVPERSFTWQILPDGSLTTTVASAATTAQSLPPMQHEMGAGHAMTTTIPGGGMGDRMAMMQGMMGNMGGMMDAMSPDMMPGMMGMMQGMMGQMEGMMQEMHQLSPEEHANAMPQMMAMMQDMMGNMDAMMAQMHESMGQMPPADRDAAMGQMMDMMHGMMGMMKHTNMNGEHDDHAAMMTAMEEDMAEMMSRMQEGNMPAESHDEMMAAMQEMMAQMQAHMQEMHGDGAAGMHDHGGAAVSAAPTAAPMDHTAAHGGHALPLSAEGVPAAAESVGGQPLAFTLDNGVKVFELTARPVRWRILDDVTVTAWTYNGVVPGPMIRVTAGDQVRIVLKNELPEATSIHWHGLPVPNAMDGVTPVAPGESFAYEFTAPAAGSYMYHSHMQSDTQVMVGLYAPFVVDPRKPQAEAPDVDVMWMLSEWRVDASGQTYPAMPMSGMEANYFTINGKAYPNTEPIAAKQGQRVRVRIANIGQLTHPMHLHGMNFRVVAYDGVTLPPAQQVTRNTIAVNPGEIVDIEFVAQNPGTWMFHCHVLHHVTNDGVEPGGLLALVKIE